MPFEGFGLALRPDLRSAAAYGPSGIISVGEGKRTRTLAEEPAYSANWLPDGSGLLYTNAKAIVKVASSEKRATELAGPAAGRYSGCSLGDPYSWCGGPLPYVTPELTKLVYTAAPSPDGGGEVRVVPLQGRE